MDEDGKFPNQAQQDLVAALNEAAEPGVDNQLFWVLANNPQWWDLVLEADVEPIRPEEFLGPLSEFPPYQRTVNEIEIKLHSGRRIVVPYPRSVFFGCWLSRDDLRDLFGADHQSGKPRESSRTTLQRLRLRGDIRVEKVNPHGWVRMPPRGGRFSRKMRLQTSLWNLRDIWNTLDLSTGIGMLLILGGMFAFFTAGYFVLQIVFGLSP